MDSVYQAAIDERKALAKRMQEIDDFLSLYDRFAATTGKQPSTGTPINVGLKKASIKETIAEATDILKDGRHHPTAELLADIRRRGFDIGGGTEKAKLLNLSNALSREGKNNGTFKADRSKGWSLKAPKSKSPTSVVALAGPILRGNSNLSARESESHG
jgi:hypothetical protein